MPKWRFKCSRYVYEYMAASRLLFGSERVTSEMRLGRVKLERWRKAERAWDESGEKRGQAKGERRGARKGETGRDGVRCNGVTGATQLAGPSGILPAQLTDDVWDFIFKKGASPKGCSIPMEMLKKMRGEFEYWCVRASCLVWFVLKKSVSRVLCTRKRI